MGTEGFHLANKLKSQNQYGNIMLKIIQFQGCEETIKFNRHKQ